MTWQLRTLVAVVAFFVLLGLVSVIVEKFRNVFGDGE